MLVDASLGPCEPAAVDDAPMVELVADDEVVFVDEGWYCSRVCCEAGLEGYRCFAVLEPGESLF